MALRVRAPDLKPNSMRGIANPSPNAMLGDDDEEDGDVLTLANFPKT